MGLVLLFLLFVVLPIAELYVIIQVGDAIGVGPTIALILAGGFLGAYLARSQGRIAWLRFNQAMGEARVPAREVMDGAMIIFGGALLLTPGFITDILGILLLLPPSRAIFRGMMRWGASKTTPGRPFFFVLDRVGSRRPGSGPAGSGRGPGPGAAGTPPPRPAPGPRPSRTGYDVDGTAREIHDDESALPEGERQGERRDG